MPALGRLVEHDERSRQYPARLATRPKKVLWAHAAPVLDQKDLGSCTGNALAQLLNTSTAVAARRRARKSSRYLTEADAVHLYSRATALDDFPGQYEPDDTGSSGLAVCKAGAEAGFFTEYRHAFGFGEFTRAIVGGPVIAGTSWYDGMFATDAAGFVWPTGGVVGGHEYLVLGYDPTACEGRGRVAFLQSWGPAWGRLGRFFMRGDVFAELLADQGDVTVPVLAAT